MKFKYGDKVDVIKGFFKGNKGLEVKAKCVWFWSLTQYMVSNPIETLNDEIFVEWIWEGNLKKSNKVKVKWEYSKETIWLKQK